MFLLYVTYLAAKNVYTSEIIEIVRHFGVSKSDASAAASFSFFAYALCQIPFVKLIKKLDIRKYLLICSPVSAALYALVPFCPDIRLVWVIFALEGALLTGVFPVCMVVISEYLPDELIPRANRYTGYAFALSFALDYFCSALFIHTADWRLGFFVFPALYMLTVIFFCRVLSICPKQIREEEKKEKRKTDKKAVFRYLFVSGTICLLVNLIYYAVSGWVPNMLSEVFGLTPALSVLITLLIPLTGAAGAAVCLELCRRFVFRRVVIIFTLAALAVSAALTAFYGLWLVMTLILVVLLLFDVRGLAHVFGWQVPVDSKDIMNPASAATVINIFGCIGAAAGPPLFGALADNAGYAAFFGAAAVCSAVLCVFTLADGKKKPV